MIEEKEKLTTEHELYLSIGLKVAVKPSVFKEEIDKLLFENVGYMQSWGTHTKDEYIGIIGEYEAKNKHLLDELEKAKNPRPIDEWHEDYGPVLWWSFPIEEPPYCGTPLDTHWPDYHTHWTPIVEPAQIYEEESHE